MYIVNEERLEKLTAILKKLNNEGVTEETRSEALNVVANIDPIELSVAEQRLIEQGMNPQDLDIQRLNSYSENPGLFIKLGHLADNILDAEKHHKREEDVLFPELEKRNITGPTRIMRMEHDDLRKRKRLLKETAHVAETMNFSECKKKVDELAKYIVFHLRDHIYKENYILYPTAVDAIKDKALWTEMKNKSDKIGYCPFTLEN